MKFIALIFKNIKLEKLIDNYLEDYKNAAADDQNCIDDLMKTKK